MKLGYPIYKDLITIFDERLNGEAQYQTVLQILAYMKQTS